MNELRTRCAFGVHGDDVPAVVVDLAECSAAGSPRSSSSRPPRRSTPDMERWLAAHRRRGELAV
jgi:hypothetical protein